MQAMISLQVGRARYPAVDNRYGPHQSFNRVKDSDRKTSGEVASAARRFSFSVGIRKVSVGENF
jgi:hypothetical protein